MMGALCSTTYHNRHVALVHSCRHQECCKERKKYVRVQFMVGMSHGSPSFQIRMCYINNITAACCYTTPIARSSKTHLYWCMKNCNHDSDVLRNKIMAIFMCVLLHLIPVCSFLLFSTKGCHTLCHLESPCCAAGYLLLKVLLTNPDTINGYETALRKTLIYRYMEFYCRVCLLFV